MGKPEEQEIDTNKLKAFVEKYRLVIIGCLIILLAYATFEIGWITGQTKMLNFINDTYNCTCLLK